MVRHHILFYDYVDDVLERRPAFRPAHLELVRANSSIVMAGAIGDPPHGAAIVFGPDSEPADVEAFASADPYVTGGLVTAWRVVPWMVV